MKPDQERVKNLLTDTVTLLCKNGLAYQDQLRIEGLLCVTIDADNFFVHISKLYSEGKEEEETQSTTSEKSAAAQEAETEQQNETQPPETPEKEPAASPSPAGRASPSRRKRRRSEGEEVQKSVKVEVEVEDDEDDLILVEPDSKEGIVSGRRVPELHGDIDAMQQGYMSQYSPSSGEPNRKRNRNSSQPNSPYMKNTSWSDASYNDGSNMSADSMPGCSSWQPGDGGGGGTGAGPADLVVDDVVSLYPGHPMLIQPAPHVKRPMNAWMLFLRDQKEEFNKQQPQGNRQDLAKSASEKWKSMSLEEKQPYYDKQAELAEEHRRLYPNYRFPTTKPRGKPRKAFNTPNLKAINTPNPKAVNILNTKKMPFNTPNPDRVIPREPGFDAWKAQLLAAHRDKMLQQNMPMVITPVNHPASTIVRPNMGAVVNPYSNVINKADFIPFENVESDSDINKQKPTGIAALYEEMKSQDPNESIEGEGDVEGLEGDGGEQELDNGDIETEKETEAKDNEDGIVIE